MAQLHSRLIWFILLAMLFFVGFLYWQTQQTNGTNRSRVADVAVKTAKVESLAMSREVSALGTGIANNSIQLIAPSSEFLIELNVSEGKKVEQGEVIARLNNVQQRARVAELDAVLMEQSRQLDRLKNLATTQAAAQSLLDEQQSKVNSTKAQLDIARQQLTEMTIKAPFTGHLGLRQVSQGAYVSGGTVITTLDDMQQLRVAFSIAERYLAEVAVGMPISVTNVAYGNIKFQGKVSAIDTRLDPITRSVTIHGIIDNESLQLRPGMLLNVQLQLENREVLRISEKALLPQQNRQYVFIVDSENKVQQKEIEVGQRIPGWVEVISGLREGDEIVIEGVQKLRTGVTISKVGG
ncbi:efflux RND transporter periplasmic adaptor subunit [Alishewanella tabrizica]|uniref:MexH family multidrug efflux RND transporter periplasmic adaptor subunit n=1 Tax=Alishewanella tabrizica TaxID=671278 RepID=A0ABQ2WEY6_9ALTE|nr:efflux RND transporter periplasmic adaptor subunit [Alishewanella tabrizica]GGW50435.1 MexH family multidrug efflux RND transporter periplasmic adaptor subunit [Alishewanella tabrizica]